MAKVYTTMEVLKRVRISRTTLYNWLNKGKVPDAHRDRNNYRVFTNRDIKRLLDYKNLIREPIATRSTRGRSR